MVRGSSRLGANPEIQIASQADSDELCNLFGRVFQALVTPESWAWKYHDPDLAGHVNILLKGAGRVLGHAGVVILPGIHEGVPAPMAQICDVMLAPDARGGAGPKGPYARLIQGLIDNLRTIIPDGLYFGFPGERPFRLGERLGFYRRIGPVHEYLRPAVDGGPSFWRLSPLRWEDPRLDHLWMRHGHRPGCRIVRNRRYLGWRYARNPHHIYQLLGVWHGWSLAGWLVIHRQGSELLVVDRLIDERSLVPVLGALGGWAKDEGAATLVWWRGDYQGPEPSDVVKRDTGLIGGVMPASGPRFAHCMPTWQPGDTDVR